MLCYVINSLRCILQLIEYCSQNSVFVSLNHAQHNVMFPVFYNVMFPVFYRIFFVGFAGISLGARPSPPGLVELRSTEK